MNKERRGRENMKNMKEAAFEAGSPEGAERKGWTYHQVSLLTSQQQLWKLACDDGRRGFLDSVVGGVECERLRSDAVRSYRVFPFEEEQKIDLEEEEGGGGGLGGDWT